VKIEERYTDATLVRQARKTRPKVMKAEEAEAAFRPIPSEIVDVLHKPELGLRETNVVDRRHMVERGFAALQLTVEGPSWI